MVEIKKESSYEYEIQEIINILQELKESGENKIRFSYYKKRKNKKIYTEGLILGAGLDINNKLNLLFIDEEYYTKRSNNIFKKWWCRICQQ